MIKPVKFGFSSVNVYVLLVAGLGVATMVAHAIYYPQDHDQSCPVSIGDRLYVPTDIYPVQHRCSTCDGQERFPICQRLNSLVIPDIDAENGRYVIANNGLWGELDWRTGEQGPSESSLAAIVAANRAGIHAINLDVLLVPGDDGNVANDLLVAAAYKDMKAYGGIPGQAVGMDIINHKMRKRDQSRETSTQESINVLPFSNDFAVHEYSYSVMDQVLNDSLILIVNPMNSSFLSDKNPDLYFRTLAAALYKARNHFFLSDGNLSNIVLRTLYPYEQTINGMSEYIDMESYNGKFLLAPSFFFQPSMERHSLDRLLERVNTWHLSSDNSKKVAFYLYNLDNEQSLANEQFVANIHTTVTQEYENIVDYTMKLSEIPIRSAAVAASPKNQRGMLNSNYESYISPYRLKLEYGNPLYILAISPILGIITDIPKFYLSVMRHQQVSQHPFSSDSDLPEPSPPDDQ